MVFRDDEEARVQRLAALEREAGRAGLLEARVRELEAENQQLREALQQAGSEAPAPTSPEGADVGAIHVDGVIERYVEAIVSATRDPASHGLAELADHIVSGARPSDAVAVLQAARQRAAAAERRYVVPADIKRVVPDVLRERIVLGARAAASGITAERALEQLLERVEVP